jgi:hypothetical protein
MSTAMAPLGVPGRTSAAHGVASRRLRRLGIGLFFGSVAVNAALGIAALVIGEFSETHGKILGTSLSVTGALVIALACLPAWERRLLGPVPPIGAGLGVIAFGLVIVSLWTGGDDEVLGRTMGSTMVAAVACALACVLGLARLAPRYRTAFPVALGLTTVASTMLVVAMWTEPESSWYPRTFGVVAVLLAATVVSIPVLARLGRAAPETLTAEPIAFCPYCGAPVAPAATARCTSCGRAFSVRLASSAPRSD